MSELGPIGPPPSTAVEEPEPQVSRGLLIALGAIGGLAALFALWTFVVSPLLSGDDELASDGASPAPTQDVADADGQPSLPTPEPTPAMAMMLGQPVPETFEIFTARDPFQQLVIELPAGGEDEPLTASADPSEEPADTTAPGTTAPSPTATGSLTPQPSASGTQGSGTAAPSAGSSASEPTTSSSEGNLSDQSAGAQERPSSGGEVYHPPNAGTIRITLVAVMPMEGGTEGLLVTIDEEEHEVVEGQVFAERFWLLDIDDSCATFLFGDSRFTLCEGDTIMK